LTLPFKKHISKYKTNKKNKKTKNIWINGPKEQKEK
jgi:hypothetical protein